MQCAPEEIIGFQMEFAVRHLLVSASAMLVLACEPQSTVNTSGTSPSNEYAAEAIANEIAAWYDGQDGEDHCFMRLHGQAFDHFIVVRQNKDSYWQSTFAVAHVCDRIVPGEAAAMGTAIAYAKVGGRDAVTIEEAQEIAPNLWAQLFKESPDLVAKMREHPS